LDLEVDPRRPDFRHTNGIREEGGVADPYDPKPIRPGCRSHQPKPSLIVGETSHQLGTAEVHQQDESPIYGRSVFVVCEYTLHRLGGGGGGEAEPKDQEKNGRTKGLDQRQDVHPSISSGRTEIRDSFLVLIRESQGRGPPFQGNISMARVE
jgi:hypothetical protein